MAYKNLIPQAGDIPSQSQSDILENFTQLNSQIGTEHTALTAAIGNGKHKYITLVQAPAVPAPAGTELALSQQISVTQRYLEVVDSAGNKDLVPLRRQAYTVAVPAGTGDRNLFDMSLLGNHHAGTIQVFDNLNPDRHNLTTYVYITGTLSIPVGSAQLTATNHYPSAPVTTFEKMLSAGNFVQMRVNSYPAGGTTVTVIITWSFV